MEEEYQKDNEVKIAGRDIRIYNGEILEALQKHDETMLSATEAFRDTMIYIAHMWEAVGVEIDKKFKNDRNGKIRIIGEELKGYRNKRTGKVGNLMVYKLGLIKNPELFRFTFPDKKLDIAELNKNIEIGK